MSISWRSGLRRRVAAVATSAVLVGGGVGAFAVANAATAGAVGVTHKTPSTARSIGAAIEGAARLTFSCNDATGAFKLKLTNVQVIKANGTSRWDDLQVVYLVNGVGAQPDLAQNTVNGLYGLSISGTLASTSDCHSGVLVEVEDVDLPGNAPRSLHFLTNLL